MPSMQGFFDLNVVIEDGEGSGFFDLNVVIEDGEGSGFFDLNVVIEDGEGSVDVLIAQDIVARILSCTPAEFIALDKKARKEKIKEVSRELVKLEGIMTLERIAPPAGDDSTMDVDQPEWCAISWEEPSVDAWPLLQRVERGVAQMSRAQMGPEMSELLS
ncbi:hypothetical protein T484DRAFT_1918395 [Baffinella frigidus]|nr:hypothetical protein T484DRAFT_1918395 [Cryptophyta sp. CCMP2293]